MKKILYILILILFNLSILCSQEINSYQQILIHEFKIGNLIGEIGYDNSRKQMTGFAGPQSFAIDSLENIYIGDVINCRINIYYPDFSVLRQINNSEIKELLYFTYKIKLDEENNLIIYSDGYGLLKIDQYGKQLFYKKNSDLPSNIVGGYDFFGLNDVVLLYDKDNNKVKIIEDTGEIIEFNQYIEKNENSKTESTYNKTQSEKKENIAINEGIITYKNKVLSESIINHLKENDQKNLNNEKEITRSSKISLNLERFQPASLISFDNDGNSYWNCRINGDRTKKVILILTNLGEVLDCLYNNMTKSIIAISQKGDIYFLDYNKHGAKLYKTSRQW